MCRDLLAERAQLAIYDPKVAPGDIRRELAEPADADPGAPAPGAPRFTIARNAYEACEGAHAIAVLTEWDEFKSLDYARILASMPRPAFVFDGRNILDLARLRSLGFQSVGIGK